MKRIFACMLALAMLLPLTACGSSDTPAPAPEPPAKAEAPTQTEAAPAEVEIPEPEPEPEPIVIPDPVVYTGSGDSVLGIEPFGGEWVMHIIGNPESHHFSVTGYDAAGNETDLFVNTTEIYEGYLLDPTQSTSVFEIKAVGDWTIEIVSLWTMPVLTDEESLGGAGDDVWLVKRPDYLWTFEVYGNEDEHHFAVKGYDEYLNYIDLFVNTTQLYSGRCIDVSQSVAVLAVTAQGNWGIQLEDLSKETQAARGMTLNGSGDAVFFANDIGNTITVKGNADAHHFAVKSYNYSTSELLVNTTEPYEGTVMLHEVPVIFVVTAESNWSITFN